MEQSIQVEPYFSMMKPNCFAQVTKSSHIMNIGSENTNLLAQMSLQKKANLGKEGIENYLRSWCKQSYEWSKINTSLLLHESTTMSRGQEK
jgi:hypothetical protein